MCGLVAIFDLQGRREVDALLLERMTRALQHRGPDAEGFYREAGLALGFRRLAIVDRAGGHQPVQSDEGQVVVVCNGEIYNHDQLRAELVHRGHRFRSRNDIEVIPALYLERGLESVAALDGQFALALWDGRERCLVLARDPFGICPLFYTVTQTGWLLVASEIKALLLHPEVRREVDLRGLDQVLCFPGLVSPTTFFAGIRSVPPGHRLRVAHESWKEDVFWDLVYPREGEGPSPRSAVEYQERLAELFKAAVRKRLQGEVDVGLYLSGGLDSSLIGGVAHALTGETGRPFFSSVFADGAIDESRYQKMLAEHVGARYHPVPFSWSETPELLAQVLWHCECPIQESYNTCSITLARAAKAAGVPVILSGDGSDELFAGYVGYRFDRGLRQGEAFFDPDAVFEEEISERLFGDPSLFYEKDQYAFGEVRRALYAEPLAAELDRFDCLDGPLIDVDKVQGRHPLHQRSYLDLKLRLADHLVSDHGDRMTMAHSVEGRYPFLDRAIAELAAEIPPELKLAGLSEKYLVKEIARPFVPLPIIEREKLGFHAPGSPHFLRHFPGWMADTLSPERIRRQGLFNPTFVASLVARYQAPGFRLQLPYETDLLFVVLSTSLLLDVFELGPGG